MSMAKDDTYKLRFLPMEEHHVEWARMLHNDESTLMQLTDPEYVNQVQQRAWFESMSLSKSSKRFVVEATVTSSVGSPTSMVSWVTPGWSWIGVFRVDNIDLKNRSVMVGLDITPEHRGHGLSKPIYEHFLSYYFDQCGMNRVYLKVLETNARAIHIYKKLGFIEEGRDRQAVFREGAFRDYVCMSILRDEWRHV